MQELNNEKELDYRTTFEQILSGEYKRIHVTGWDEAMQIEEKEPLLLLRIDQFQTYWDNKYFCTTTKDGKLP
jgi:hypothetical protein